MTRIEGIGGSIRKRLAELAWSRPTATAHTFDEFTELSRARLSRTLHARRASAWMVMYEVRRNKFRFRTAFCSWGGNHADQVVLDQRFKEAFTGDIKSEAAQTMQSRMILTSLGQLGSLAAQVHGLETEMYLEIRRMGEGSWYVPIYWDDPDLRGLEESGLTPFTPLVEIQIPDPSGVNSGSNPQTATVS